MRRRRRARRGRSLLRRSLLERAGSGLFGRRVSGRLMRNLFVFYASLLIVIVAFAVYRSSWHAGRVQAVFSSGVSGVKQTLALDRRGILPYLVRWAGAGNPNEDVSKAILDQGIPALGTSSGRSTQEKGRVPSRGETLRSFFLILTNLDPSDPRSLLDSGIPVLAGTRTAEAGELNRAKPAFSSSNPSSNANPGSDSGSRVASPDISEIKHQWNGPVSERRVGKSGKWGSDPIIAIYHSHSSEAYRPTSGSNYVWGSSEGVIKVGDELVRRLVEKYDIPVVHSRKIHDFPKWRESYVNSFTTISGILKDDPSIEMVFDIHRDAVPPPAEGGDSVIIKGRRVARIFTVVTTDKFGLPHPKWRENLAFARYLTAKMDDMYPGLSRGIDVRNDARWNQHVHPRAVILEIGAVSNTREEAIEAAKLVADVVAAVLRDIVG